MHRRSDGGTPKNGAAPLSSFAAAGGASALYDDPMSRVLGLDAKTSTLGARFGFMSGSALLLVGLMASSRGCIRSTAALLATPDEIEILKEEAPPPPAPTEREIKPEPAAAPPPRPREAPAPPPAPAQAAKVLTQEPDPNEPVDLTGNTIVQGSADTYAGGFTSAKGTDSNAVRNVAAPTGTIGGTGTPRLAQPTGRDLSRLPSVGNTDWNRCPFPPEADTAQIDEAYVTLELEIRADGTPSAVRVLNDPGNGFGREARQYAMKQRYPPAWDHDGNPIPGTTKVRVHFSR